MKSESLEMKDIFGGEIKKLDEKYTRKIKAPLYSPSGECPSIYDLCDMRKYHLLIREIDICETITPEEKDFLKLAAMRHIVFDYGKIADYYSHASKDLQELMENSALVIVDFDKAIQLGYIKLASQIKKQFNKEVEDDNK